MDFTKTEFTRFIRKPFGNKTITFWFDAKNDLWTTASEIGQALEYKNPNKAVMQFCKRHWELGTGRPNVRIGTYSNGVQRYEALFFDEFSAHLIAVLERRPGWDAHIPWLEKYKTIHRSRKFEAVTWIGEKPGEKISIWRAIWEILHGTRIVLVKPEARSGIPAGDGVEKGA